MQAKKSIEIKHGLARNINCGPHGVILLLAVWDNDVQSVGRASLKDHDQPFRAHARLSRAHGGASQKARYRRRADNGKRAVTKKDATCDGHKKQLLAASC
jgi:hypothetical protein